MVECIYNNPKWKKTLLETPSGFALFEVNEVALKEPNDIWVYFRDVTTAEMFDDKSTSWDGDTRPSKDLVKLIQKFCDDKNDLFVQSADLQAIITKNLNIECSYDPDIVDEVVWGLKSVLHKVIPEEKDNITREYCLPMSKGLQHYLQENLINVSPTMLSADFMSEMGLAQYLNITLKQVPKILREFDEHVCRIGESIEDDLKYARVLARILVPELAPDYDFSEMFSPNLAQKIQEADKFAAQYREKKLTMRNREIIMGGLAHLLAVPEQRDDIMTRVKLMEAKLHKTEVMMLEDDTYVMSEHVNSEPLTFRRTLLETPSGFAIFDVDETVFKHPERIWSWFTDELDAREVVLALGFVKVHDKSIARNSSDGPGEELSRLIQNLCAHKDSLIVQDDDLKFVIETKLEVKCYTSTGDDSLDDLFWGLKNVLHDFIPQEKDNLTDEYRLPLSMGLQRAFKLYGVNVSPGQIDRDFVYNFGCLANLEFTTALVPTLFRKLFDHHVSGIGKLIEDNLVYAQVAAKILVHESQREFDFKLLSSDLALKVADIAKDVAETGEAISMHDKEIILGVIEYLKSVPQKRDCFLRVINGGSVELQRVEQEWCWETNDNLIRDWIMSVTKAPMVEDEETPKMVVQNVEKTAPEVQAMHTNKSSEDKSVQGDEFGLSCQDNQQIGEGRGTTLLEEDSSDKFFVGGMEEISNPIGSAVGVKVVSVRDAADVTKNDCSSSAEMDDSMQKSQVDLVELSTSATAHEINTAGSTNDVDKKMQNEKSNTDLFSRVNFEKNQQNKEMAAYTISHDTNAVSGKDNCRENGQNEAIIAEMQKIIAKMTLMQFPRCDEQREEFIAYMQKVIAQIKQNANIIAGSP